MGEDIPVVTAIIVIEKEAFLSSDWRRIVEAQNKTCRRREMACGHNFPASAGWREFHIHRRLSLWRLFQRSGKSQCSIFGYLQSPLALPTVQTDRRDFSSKHQLSKRRQSDSYAHLIAGDIELLMNSLAFSTSERREKDDFISISFMGFPPV